MRIEQLIYLIELSHSRSLNLAAESLHISTPGTQRLNEKS